MHVADNHEVAVELEDIALGESAISESGHHSDDDDDKSSSERSEISRAPSVEHYNISVSNKLLISAHPKFPFFSTTCTLM